MTVQRLLRVGKGMISQDMSSVSRFQKMDPHETVLAPPYPIVKREKNASRLYCAKANIDPEKYYSLTETAYFTKMPRDTWVNLVTPTTTKKVVRVPCILDGTERRIKGSDIIDFISTIEVIPLETKKLEQVAVLLCKSYQSVIANDLIWHAGERYLVFRRYSDGKNILIPCYRWIDGLSLHVDSRDFEMISREFGLRRELVPIREAKKIMLDQGVDIYSAEMLSSLKNVERERDCSSILYRSPDQHEIRLRVFQHSIGDTGLKNVVRVPALMEFIKRILEYQQRFLVYNEALLQVGIKKPDSRVLSSKPRQFSYNGESRSIQLYSPVHISWIERSDWYFFLTWRRFSELLKQKVYVPVIKELCHAFSGELIRKNFEKFAKSVSRIGVDGSGFNELAIPLSSEYGIWLRVYEIDGTWVISKTQSDLARFARNVNSHDGITRVKAINLFEKEMLSSNSHDFNTAIKLWILRDVLMRNWEDEPGTSRCSEIRFDAILSNSKAVAIFREYPLERVETLLRSKNSDLRYMQAEQSDLIQNAVYSSNNYVPDLYALK